jgi:AbrB family looped-hinge helix DNA binding protein
MIIKREMGEKGQVVIPKDIRDYLKLRKGSKIVFEIINEEVKIKSEEDVNEFLKRFFSLGRMKKRLTLDELKEIEDESYDLP